MRTVWSLADVTTTGRNGSNGRDGQVRRRISATLIPIVASTLHVPGLTAASGCLASSLVVGASGLGLHASASAGCEPSPRPSLPSASTAPAGKLYATAAHRWALCATALLYTQWHAGHWTPCTGRVPVTEHLQSSRVRLSAPNDYSSSETSLG